MWTIGRSQRVEEKKYRPIVRKLRYINVENTEGAIKKGQSKETSNIGYTRRRQTKQKHNTTCVRHPYTQIT
jgi:hypothetical protein